MKQKKSTDKEQALNAEAEKTANVADQQQESAENTSGETGNRADEGPDLQKKVDELNDKLLRLYSEFDNYRKRTIREKQELSKTASEELITDLLPVMDDFERALKSFESTDNAEALKEGVQLIYTKFRNTLSAKGLQEIKSVGEPFDTDLQEAIAHIPAPADDMKNKVIDEVQKGYKLHDKVIRHAKVVVGS